MGRPLNKSLMGNPSLDGKQFFIEAWIPGGSDGVTAWILEQKTNNQYIVTDDSNTGRCRLQKETLTAEGQMRMAGMPFGFDIAAASATMKADFLNSVDGEGSGYAIDEKITLIGGTASTFTVMNVETALLRSATTVTPGVDYVPGDILTITGGAGSSLFVTDCKAVSATVDGEGLGTGYVTGEIVTLFGGTKVSPAKVIITNVQAESGAILAAGSGYDGADIVEIDVISGAGSAPTFNVTNVFAVSVTVDNDGEGALIDDTLTMTGVAGTGVEPTFNVDSVNAIEATVDTPGVGYDGSAGGASVVTLAGATAGTAATFDVDEVQVVSVLLFGNGGVGYSVGDTPTASGGTASQNAIFDVDTIQVATAQDQSDYDGLGTGNGSFIGGNTTAPTAYEVSETIFLSDGSRVRVNSIDGSGDVVTFVITQQSTSGSANGVTLTQASSTVSGEGFQMTLGVNNQAVFGVSVNTPGIYTAAAGTPMSTTGPTGVGLQVDPSYGMLTVSLATGGNMTTTNADPVPVSSGGGSGGKLNVIYGVEDVSIITPGNFTAIPSNPVPMDGGGTGVALNVLYGALTITLDGGGNITDSPTNPASTTATVGTGAGLTINVVYKIFAAALTDSGSKYTVLPNNAVIQDTTTGSGSSGAFDIVWGVDTVVRSNDPSTDPIPSNPVSTTGEIVGTGATFNASWGVNSASIFTPGDYSVVPSNSVGQGSTSGIGSGALFNLNWSVLNVIVDDGGGGYVNPPAVSFSGGGGTGASATSTLTTNGGTVPPDEQVATIAVVSDGEGYSSAPTVTVAAPAGDIEYVKLLNAHQVKTFEGNVYTWSEFLADDFGEIDLDLA